MSAIDVKSEISGRVFEIVARPGDRLAEDDPVMILEAMKMEIAVGAPCNGVVKQILVGNEDSIAEGQVVAILEAV
ncbi:acetyl-CoA carboxylase biotin carboxyl carrier protein subunit [Camelimonas fluminis]|uniref:Acetyl-CoA carboxylase biotin carboxyl carrier protein subunit n=1 Tax=Camelimonas fluminis TaxID=1576911 RepID=A0ABV7UK28_9HYPH|nr:acetyl-CoA carboxylase biotin carboxyl carrier protein subunit [Camelimonas fluminis]GHE68725.1 acetyl-CoA carboxylase biotin carboxyl carrier protein subunit [Camelimonas fluminis]